jgi:ribonuclease BN (tRNA processing enzyme)
MSTNNSMTTKVWGCRGSISISGPNSVKYGGNTTCYEVISSCLPPKMKLFVDAGTGFVPAGNHYVSKNEAGLNFLTLFSHYHYDHTMGLTLSPPTFYGNIPMTFYGPKDFGKGPKDVVKDLFRQPQFPVDAKSVMGKMVFRTMEGFDVTIIVIHPEGGVQNYALDQFQKIERNGRQVTINKNHYKLEECMVIKMQKTTHSNSICITYRFEERPTGKSMVILTDHEDTTKIPMALRNHLNNADLLLMDGQYDEKRMTMTAGFGHGTPKGIVRYALATHVKKIGVIHHDPSIGTDDYLENEILGGCIQELRHFTSDEEFLKEYKIIDPKLNPENFFLCADYMEIPV